MKPTPLPNMGGTIPLEYVARLERDRAELIEALRECAAALNCEPDADACAGQKASALLSRLGAE